MSDRVATPEEFLASIEAEAAICTANGRVDCVGWHERTDRLMEDLLISLGYAGGINLIRDSTRWYE